MALANKADQAPARRGQRCSERSECSNAHRARARRGQRQRWQSCHHRNRQGRVIFYLNSLPKPLPVMRPAILRPTRRETEPLRLDVIACASPRYLAKV